MRRTILTMSVSLDGFLEAADRDISWHLVDDELLRHLNGQFRTVGGFMFGRITQELHAARPDVRRDLRLEWMRAYDNGVVLLHYSNDRALNEDQPGPVPAQPPYRPTG